VAFENARPIEFDVGVVLLDQADGVLIEGRSADAYAWRRAKPIKDARARLTATPTAGAVRVHDKRILVAAFVARKPQMRQNYFLF